jgi:GTP diphosphokinase / guanosine-3',5'-bis(diphosphate) 3'-diphosphatase
VYKKVEDFAKSFHKDHKRVSGEPYFAHVERTVTNLKNNKIEDPVLISAAFLHHVLCFDSSKEAEIRKLFGDDVTELLKKNKKLSDNPMKIGGDSKVNEEHVIQAYMNMAGDHRIILIRLADKVDNVETATYLPKKNRVEVADKALRLYAPLARLSSLGNFASRLEEGAFKMLYPAHYVSTVKKIERIRPKAEMFFESTVPPLGQLLEENGIKTILKQRVKRPYSYFKKELQCKGRGKRVYDQVGIRIITESVDDCYKAEDIVNQLWSSLPSERDDYIQKPKISGYRSIHSIFKITNNMHMEIQIRTKEMDEMNEYGKASHALYKMGSGLKKELEKTPGWLKEMSYENYRDNIKLDQFSHNVYVYTPKQDIIKLPEGSNLIDFAYYIHPEVGNSAVGGYVNDEYQKLTHKLKTGDRVLIKTSKSRKLPSEDWVKLVGSKRTKRLIKKSLREGGK